MKKINTYIAYFLLVAFSWVITPTPTIHDLFADHHDTADNFCKLNHAHLGTHIEEQHTHCGILDLNAPVYSAPQLVTLNIITLTVNTLVYSFYQSRFISFSVCNLPSRGPPTVA
ncbi:MAG: hypothetical protein SGJ15_01475 [Bacteroidota bacterium]|nr:hypothetical protein [Bacteroidota bacterium]